MSSFNVVITEAAQRDLLDIFDYIVFGLCEPESAGRLLSKIRTKVITLKKFPDRNKIVSEPKYEVQKIRWCPVENHVIFYQLSEADTQVYVLRVLYKKRNWEHLLSPS